MKTPFNIVTPCKLAALALPLLLCVSCAFTVVRPAPLVVGSDEMHNLHVVKYPAYVLVHDSDSFWDAHQIKDNLVGLTEGEVVHWLDLAYDHLVPTHTQHPIDHSIDWIKDRYAQLPNCAPVRIVDGFFTAFGFERETLITGATKIAAAPADPVSYFVLTRFIYLTDWVQDTVGEFNSGAGHINPWSDKLVPHVITRPINAGVDWAQFGVITLYIRVFRSINNGVDTIIDRCEDAWGDVVYAVLWSTNTLEIAEDKTKMKEPDVGNQPGPGSRSR